MTPSAPAPVADAAARGGFVFAMNAAAGKSDAPDLHDVIARVLGEAGVAFEVVDIGDASRIAEQARIAVERARARGAAVIAVGGDGTLNAVAAAVLGSGLTFGAVPQGTFNYFGRAHGIPQDGEAAVRALLQARARPVQIGRVNGEPFLVNASVGVYPRLLEDREVDKREHGRSRWVAMWSGLLSLMRTPRQLRLEIQSEQGTRQIRTPTLFVSNNALQLDQVGVDEADAVAQNRGLVAIIVRPIGSLGMLWLALRGALGRLGDAKNVETFAFHTMRVDPVGHRRIKVATDGEVRVMATPLRFDVAPQPLLLLVPARAERVQIA